MLGFLTQVNETESLACVRLACIDIIKASGLISYDLRYEYVP